MEQKPEAKFPTPTLLRAETLFLHLGRKGLLTVPKPDICTNVMSVRCFSPGTLHHHVKSSSSLFLMHATHGFQDFHFKLLLLLSLNIWH